MKRIVCIIALIVGVATVASGQGWTMIDDLKPSAKKAGPMSEPGVVVTNMFSVNGYRVVTGTYYDILEYRGMRIDANGNGFFVLKIDEEGNPLSLRNLSMSEAFQGKSIVMDKYENVYVTGIVEKGQTTDFGYTNSSSKNAYILVKYRNNSSNGYDYVWHSEVMRSEVSVEVSAIHVGEDGNIYMAGRAGKQLGTVLTDKTFPYSTISPVDSLGHKFPDGRYGITYLVIERNNLLSKMNNSYKQGNYKNLFDNKLNLDTLKKYYYQTPEAFTINDFGICLIWAMLDNQNYRYSNDSLTKYGIDELAKGNAVADKWVKHIMLHNAEFDKYTLLQQQAYRSEVIVGDKTYSTEVNFVKLLMCFNSNSGSLVWSKGFPAIFECYRSNMKDANDIKIYDYMRPVQWAPSGIFRDLLYFDGKLFVAGANDGYTCDGIEFRAMSPYTNKGAINYNANPGADLMLMCLNATDGGIQWAQTGGGRGSSEQYMRIVRNEDFIYAIGEVDPGTSTVINDAIGGTFARDGVVLDSVVRMMRNSVVSQDGTMKLSSRFASNGTKGMIYAKYNTEGRLLSKTYVPGASVSTDFDLNVKLGVLVSAGRIQRNSGVLQFNNDKVSYPEGGWGAFVYDLDGNPITMLTFRDSMYDSDAMKVCVDDKYVYAGGRFFSKKIEFEKIDGSKHVVQNLNYHDKSYYMADNYFSVYFPISGRTDSSFYTYHGGHYGFLAKGVVRFAPAFSHVKNVRCHGNNDGELTVTPFFHSGTCEYKWYKYNQISNDWELQQINIGTESEPQYVPKIDSAIFNLSAGKYKVVVSDVVEGSVVASAELEKEITQPDKLEVVLTPIDVTNWCEHNGEIKTSVSGGVGGYTYFWSVEAGASGDIAPENVKRANQSNLMAGVYKVTVQDKNVCTKTAIDTVSLSVEPLSISSPVTQDITSSGDDGSIELTISGGNGSHSITWIDPNQTPISSNNPSKIESLSVPGTYMAIVTDESGCKKEMFIHIKSEKLDNICVVEVLPASVGKEDGQVKFSSSTSTYETTWKKKEGDSFVDIGKKYPDGNGFFTVAAGTYEITLTFNSRAGQTLIFIVIVGQKNDEIRVTPHLSNVSCNDDKTTKQDIGLTSDGSIVLDIEGGTPPYSFKWYKNDDNNAFTNTQNVSGLSVGTYKVEIFDEGKYSSAPYIISPLEINAPDPIEITAKGFNLRPPSCLGKDDGILEIIQDSISGGNKEYWHIWSNTLMASEIHGLGGKNYYVDIYDKLGCKKRFSGLNMQYPMGMQFDLESTTNPTCAEIANGSISVGVYGGEPFENGYKYEWSSSVPITSEVNNATLQNVSAGTYMLTVTDQKNCTVERTYTLVPEGASPNISIALSMDEICAGEEVEVTASGSNGGYNYFVDGQSRYGIISDDVVPLRVPIDDETKTYEIYVEGYGDNQCMGRSIKLPLTANRVPSSKIFNDSSLVWCQGVTPVLNLSADTLAGVAGIEWTWRRAGQQTDTLAKSIPVTEPGWYALHAKSGKCESKDSVEVEQLVVDNVSLDQEGANPWCYGEGNVVTLAASVQNAYSYTWWRNGDTLKLANGRPMRGSAIITNIPGKYRVEAVLGGCVKETEVIEIGHRDPIELPAIDTTVVAGEPYVIDMGQNNAITQYTWRNITDKQNSYVVQEGGRSYEINTYNYGDQTLRYEVQVEDNNGCKALTTAIVRVQKPSAKPTGIGDMELEHLTLYPNPTHSGFFVEAPDSDKMLRMYGAGGRLVIEHPLNGKTWISTAHLPAGLYIARTESAGAKVVVE